MSYRTEFIPAVVVVGLVTLLCVPFVSLLIALVILTLAATAALALAGAAFAAPYLLVRFVRGRRQARTAEGLSRRPAYGRFGMSVESRVPSSAILSSLNRS